jgi:hypothetical protein
MRARAIEAWAHLLYCCLFPCNFARCADWEDGGCPFDGEGGQRKEYFAARPSAQPFNQQLIQPVGCVQWDPMAGAIDLLVAPRTFNVATRYLHAFTIEVMIVG